MSGRTRRRYWNKARLARGFCAYVAVFWGIRLALQGVFDVKDYLTAWWLRLGYAWLTVMFAGFTIVYAWAALQSSIDAL